MRIVKYPHPTLRHKSKDLRRVDNDLRRMIREMFDLMYENKGIGLAANQVDLPYRFFVMNIKGDPSLKEEEHVFINPLIVRREGAMTEDQEGCLSFPEIYAPVRRREKIVVNAYNAAGQEINWELSGLYARVVQHETDHLAGILFIDHLTPSNLLAVKEAIGDMETAFFGERERGMIADDLRIAARLAELEGART